LNCLVLLCFLWLILLLKIVKRNGKNDRMAVFIENYVVIFYYLHGKTFFVGSFLGAVRKDDWKYLSV